MADWHRLGSKDEPLARVLFAMKIERHRIAVFLYNGRLTAISDICNHKGGPLSDLDKNRGVMEKPMERAGRKANPLGEVEEAIV